tara:strand:+ start:634 stop:759 length:126 start_codon:yes stop_codon:yes gene_type:complete
MSKAVRKILVVFDIDETLLQFLNKNAYSKNNIKYIDNIINI